MGILWDSFLFLLVATFALFLVRIVLFKTGLIYMVKLWRRKIIDWFHVYQFYKVPEFNDNVQENHLYQKVYSYLNSLSSIENSDFTNLFTGKKSNEIILRLDRNQVVGDEFLGARVCWINGEDEDGARNFVLKIRKADKRRILGPYLQHIHTVSDELEQRSTELKLFINDLDRYLSTKSTAVSLSGILNFTDSILSSCTADERVMVFTMTGKEQIDPAMLRPGRVDVHIHFPLCDFTAFKTLANNYLGLKEHKLFSQVEGIFQNGASLSPAEIGELMIANRSSPTRALKYVINALQTDGDRRGTGRRLLLESGSRKSTSEDVSDDMSGLLCGGGGGGSSPAVKEFRKLYGLLRIKSSRKSGSFDVAREMKDG
ncbi:hypothetical protein ARALYDRAFT_346472 [Arabidopsis lyrata subsp. lyrata]|uniref:Uncharacterized protein n=1 Tax=Arabidopsis lyrata subsp. lyrata TaxID=81972 RepID=D7LF68_ARALL|nr:hypothetical protein ARALYDRAFT_346472 [Arabidopsis lyrata subsp. lyrata]